MVEIIGRGGPTDANAFPVYTRAGRHINNERRRERGPIAWKVSIDELKKHYPEALFRCITDVYNCVGLVFASKRAWIHTDQLPLILHDDGYHPLKPGEKPQSADILMYRPAGGGEVCHVALVLTVELGIWPHRDDKITVLSKWGADAEYVHRAEYVPQALGLPAEYWSDRGQP